MRESTIQLVIAVLGLWVAVVSTLVAIRQTKKLPTLIRVLAGGFGVIVLVAFVVLLFQWLDARALALDEQGIRDTIIKGTELELAWYKQPNNDRLPDLQRYFSPINAGGDRLRQIVQQIDQFRQKNRRLADHASRALFINKLFVVPGGETASAETSEIWYQPLLELKGGTEIDVPQKTDQLNLYTPVQFYILRKIEGRWHIESNPVPVAP